MAKIVNRDTGAGSRTMLLTPVLLFCIVLSLISGGYYYLRGPANWNAAQIILSLHIGLGIMTLLLLLAYLKRHLSWGIHSGSSSRFMIPAFLLLTTFVALFSTGLFNTTPMFLYLTGTIWFPDFETFDLVAKCHLISAVLMISLMLIHLALSSGSRPTFAAEVLS